MDSIEQQNARVWEILTSHGVSPETPLVLDLFWYAKEHAAAEALAEHLRTGIAHFAQTKLVKDEWSITAQTKPQCFTLDSLQQFDRDMRAIGVKFQCAFDGWGALAPAAAKKKKKPWWQFW